MEIVLENIIVHYILLIMFNFILFHFIFYFFIVTDIRLLLRCYNGSCIEMNQVYYFVLDFLYWYYV